MIRKYIVKMQDKFDTYRFYINNDAEVCIDDFFNMIERLVLRMLLRINIIK